MLFKIPNDFKKIYNDIDFSEMKQQPIYTEHDDEFYVEVLDDEVRDFQGLITDRILEVGLDNQDTVNKLGIRLYGLYDTILYQKEDYLGK